ncbi:MAG: hypothetical protein U0796_15070 [Gemmatales bacterium]
MKIKTQADLNWYVEDRERKEAPAMHGLALAAATVSLAHLQSAKEAIQDKVSMVQYRGELLSACTCMEQMLELAMVSKCKPLVDHLVKAVIILTEAVQEYETTGAVAGVNMAMLLPQHEVKAQHSLKVA